jgi:hypothetical protein
MPCVGFEPTIPVFEREKTVHALDGAATVIGCMFPQPLQNKFRDHHQLQEWAHFWRLPCPSNVLPPSVPQTRIFITSSRSLGPRNL